MALNMKYIMAFVIGLVIGTITWFVPFPALAFTGTLTNVSGSRSINTSYQNTSGEDILVMMSVFKSSAAERPACTVLMGSASASDTIMSSTLEDEGSGDRFVSFTFMVPDTYYYRVNCVASGDSSWWEYTTPEASSGGGGGGGTILSDTVPIRFETFQAISFTLTASFCLFLLVQLLAWFMNNIFRRPARR